MPDGQFCLGSPIDVADVRRSRDLIRRVPAIYSKMVHKENVPHHNCLTGCASTYNKYRRGSKPFNKVIIYILLLSIFNVASQKGDFGIINENEEISEELQDHASIKDEEPKVEYNGERRRSSFCLAKLGKVRVVDL